jgi:hypothetical protein
VDVTALIVEAGVLAEQAAKAIINRGKKASMYRFCLYKVSIMIF